MTASNEAATYTLYDLLKLIEKSISDVRRHTATYHYLDDVIVNALPHEQQRLTLTAPGVDATYYMHDLPKDYANGIMNVLVEHSRQQALEGWRNVFHWVKLAESEFSKVESLSPAQQAEHMDLDAGRPDDVEKRIQAIVDELPAALQSVHADYTPTAYGRPEN